MKKTLLLIAMTVVTVSGASAAVIINEVYAGGGSNTAGATYTRDYVELYNTSATPFSLAGFTLQYASANGFFTGSIAAFGAGSIIGANDYLSVYTGGAGSAGATLTAGPGAGNVTYVAPLTSASLSNANGAVRLYDTATSTTIDVLGYGTVTNSTVADPKFEGATSVSPTSTASSLNRLGFADSNNNLADFSNGTPTPQGGATSVFVAAPEPSTWALIVGGLGAVCLLTRRRRTA